MKGISPIEGVIEGENAYITQSTGHSAITDTDVNECENADFTLSTGHGAFFNYLNPLNNAEFIHSTGHGAFFNNYLNPLRNAMFTNSAGHSAFFHTDMNECKNAEFINSAGHSAFFNIKSMDANEGKNADFVQYTGHSATTIGNIETQGTRPVDGLVASIKNCESSGKVTELQGGVPSLWPIKQHMHMGMNTSRERYLENLYLLGQAWVQKVRHVARLTLNSPTGPIWPTDVEHIALVLFDYLSERGIHEAGIQKRADFADELDFVWQESPPWLPPGHMNFIPIWEHVTGMARTWGWNWHNEVRKKGAPVEVWRQEERHPRTRFHQNKSSKTRHHHILAAERVPTIANYIRTNKFYRVGDDETTCERPESSPRCRDKCHHTEYALTLKKQKREKTY